MPSRDFTSSTELYLESFEKEMPQGFWKCLWTRMQQFEKMDQQQVASYIEFLNDLTDYNLIKLEENDLYAKISCPEYKSRAEKSHVHVACV